MNMNTPMFAIIRKDIRGVTGNRRLFAALLIVPLALTVLLPSVFVFTACFAPQDPDIQRLTDLLPAALRYGDPALMIIRLILNYIMPVFFLMIPIMTASIMAASSFVGEKEKHTLETLLYCPLSLKQIFQSKVLASFLLSMLVSLISFFSMMLVLELETFFLLKSLLLPGINWLIILLLVSPAISLIAVTLIVRGSAKAQTVEESQQSAVFLVIPVIMLVAGQFTGVMLLGPLVLIGLGLICAPVAWLLLKRSLGRFTYEMLLK